ncbi:MAG: DUF4351 domain-containing protein, partial [Magnetococcales bacterium]|nr:DUF4351 domain-containing protein [Magnetococcales bacterium]
TSLLLLQLKEKFGELPEETQRKIHRAERTTLEKWSLQILRANTLDEVFQTPKTNPTTQDPG